jgi:hypothetical protein
MRSLDLKIAFCCILTLSSALLSCKAQYHIERAEKHREKALNKGAIFNKDTIHVFSDTVTNTYWKDSIRYIDREIIKTVFVDGDIKYVTKKDKRVERRDRRKNEKRYFKLEKQANRLEAKTERVKERSERKRSWWWFWLLLGIFITLAAKQLYKRWLSPLL